MSSGALYFNWSADQYLQVAAAYISFSSVTFPSCGVYYSSKWNIFTFPLIKCHFNQRCGSFSQAHFFSFVRLSPCFSWTSVKLWNFQLKTYSDVLQLYFSTCFRFLQYKTLSSFFSFSVQCTSQWEAAVNKTWQTWNEHWDFFTLPVFFKHCAHT